MKLLLDINLSPSWVDFLAERNFRAVHWSQVGDPGATDAAIMAWARENHHVIFSHDLDFSHILALSHAAGPSVFQVRTNDVLPEAIGSLVVATLTAHREVLEEGAIVVLDGLVSRVRVLPIGP